MITSVNEFKQTHCEETNEIFGLAKARRGLREYTVSAIKNAIDTVIGDYGFIGFLFDVFNVRKHDKILRFEVKADGGKNELEQILDMTFPGSMVSVSDKVINGMFSVLVVL
jgi:hypothetical protein